MGNPKIINKNQVAKKANQELDKELLKVDPTGNPVSAVILLKAVCLLKSHIRLCGLSLHKLFLGRDQITGNDLKLSDMKISDFHKSTPLNPLNSLKNYTPPYIRFPKFLPSC